MLVSLGNLSLSVILLQVFNKKLISFIYLAIFAWTNSPGYGQTDEGTLYEETINHSIINTA